MYTIMSRSGVSNLKTHKWSVWWWWTLRVDHTDEDEIIDLPVVIIHLQGVSHVPHQHPLLCRDLSSDGGYLYSVVIPQI